MPGISSEKIGLVHLAMEGADYLVADKMEYAIKRTPALGLQYLSAVIQKAGGQCRIFDQPVEQFSLAGLLKRLKEEKIDVLGFYSDTYLKPKVIQWIRQLREWDFVDPILVGGPGSFDSTRFLEAGAQIVCHGEGERTILEMLEHLRGERSIDDLSGVSLLREGVLFTAFPQDFIENLDTLPFPDRSQYPVDRYFDYHYFGMRQPYVSMLASRGCPNRCAFCASSAIFGRKVRQRSAEKVADEIRWCIDEFGLKYIGFKDDIFGLKPGWIEEYSDALATRDISVRFAINLYPLSFQNRLESSLTLLKKAGLDQVVVGLQSVDAQVMKNINRRPEEPQRVVEMVKGLNKLGVTSVVEFIFGLPGDTDKTMRDALAYSLSLKPNHALFYVLSILDGSQIMEEYGPQGPETGFTKAELRKRCADYQKHFFTRPAVVMKNLLHILRINPGYFLKMARHWRYFVNAIGIKGKVLSKHRDRSGDGL